jgi:hypothetical protein
MLSKSKMHKVPHLASEVRYGRGGSKERRLQAIDRTERGTRRSKAKAARRLSWALTEQVRDVTS